jgi:hypothetical protein
MLEKQFQLVIFFLTFLKIQLHHSHVSVARATTYVQTPTHKPVPGGMGGDLNPRPLSSPDESLVPNFLLHQMLWRTNAQLTFFWFRTFTSYDEDSSQSARGISHGARSSRLRSLASPCTVRKLACFQEHNERLYDQQCKKSYMFQEHNGRLYDDSNTICQHI